MTHLKFSTTENIALRFSSRSAVKAIVRPASSMMAKVMILELALVHVNSAVYQQRKLGATIHHHHHHHHHHYRRRHHQRKRLPKRRTGQIYSNIRSQHIVRVATVAP